MRRLFTVSVLCVVFVMGSLSSSVVGASVIQDIKAQINYGMTMLLNGQSFTPRDANDKEIRPILFEGRTYVPLRAIGEALNVPVSYDSKSQQVLIGEKADASDLIALKVYDHHQINSNRYPSVDPAVLSVGKHTPKSGYVILFSNKYSSRSFDLKLNNNYSTVTLKVLVPDKDTSYKVVVYDQDKLALKEAHVDYNNEDIELSIPVGGVSTLEIEASPTSDIPRNGNAKIVIADIMGK